MIEEASSEAEPPVVDGSCGLLWSSAKMGLSVVFVSGLRRAGKSAMIRTMIDRLWGMEPHYIRLVKENSSKVAPKVRPQSPAQCGVASARWLEYNQERVFEMLPEALTAIHRRDRFGSVVIEADADAHLRFAYPYDHRLFIMPVPGNAEEVFRDSTRAAHELQRVLDDTVAFASEIFGLSAQSGLDDSDLSEERPDLTATQIRSFLYSPLGDELATRVQLQPEYHGLIESDVIIVNTSVGTAGSGTQACMRRIQQLLDRIRGVSDRRAELFLCDPRDPNGRGGKKLLKFLKPMCRGGQ